MSGFGKIYESSNWGVGVCDNTIGWGSSYKSISNCSDASFSYSADSFAQDGSNPTPTITGDAGGTFTATPAGLSINSSTGLITLSTSSVNSYTVKYELSDGTFTEQSLAITAASFANVNSFSFDGVDDYFEVPENVYSSTFSFSFWMKPSNVTNKAVMGDISNNSNFVRLDSTTSIKFKCAGGATTFTESSGNDIVLNTWQNIIITRDGSNVISVFRNGSTFGSTATLSGNFTLNSIGVAYQSGGWFFTGELDEFAIWNSALTSGNIATIYGSGVPSDLSTLNPLAWYRMGEEATFSNPGGTGNWTLVDQGRRRNQCYISKYGRSK
jgi:hypothetical protein